MISRQSPSFYECFCCLVVYCRTMAWSGSRPSTTEFSWTEQGQSWRRWIDEDVNGESGWGAKATKKRSGDGGKELAGMMCMYDVWMKCMKSSRVNDYCNYLLVWVLFRFLFKTIAFRGAIRIVFYCFLPLKTSVWWQTYSQLPSPSRFSWPGRHFQLH